MRHIISGLEGPAAVALGGELMIIVTDDVTPVPQQHWDTALVWHAEPPGPAGTCSWNLLGCIADAADADRITGHLFSVIEDEDEAALFFVPEAGLLTANLLLAAVRGKRGLTDVLGWIITGDLREPYRLLRERGENGPTQDLDTFAQSDTGERDAIWAVVRQAMLPLNDGAILAALGSDIDGTPVAAPFSMLRTRIPGSDGGRVYVVAAPSSRTAGAATALQAELKLAADGADELGTARVVNLPSTKRGR